MLWDFPKFYTSLHFLNMGTISAQAEIAPNKDCQLLDSNVELLIF